MQSLLPISVRTALVSMLTVTLLAGYAVETASQARPASGLPAAEIARIAEEAYLYGFPMIVGYKVMHDFFIDPNSGQFKAPFNEINNEARVFTPKDTTISTPNSDTPYSMVQLDLRAEPMVLCMPEIDKARYYDVQLVDLYTHNYVLTGCQFSVPQNSRRLISLYAINFIP